MYLFLWTDLGVNLLGCLAKSGNRLECFPILNNLSHSKNSENCFEMVLYLLPD